MKKALVTSEMNEDKRDHLIQMITNGVRKGIKIIGLNDESGQRVVNRGTELVDTILDKVRELSHEFYNMPCFGTDDWQKVYGITFTKKQIEAVGKFPWSDEVLSSSCPFNPGKMVRETHFAFVGLDTVNIARLQKLNPKSNEPRFHSYGSASEYFREKFVSSENLRLRWYLILRNIIPGSENKAFNEQKNMLPGEYEVPLAIEEIAKDILFYKKTGTYVNTDRLANTASLSSEGDLTADLARVGYPVYVGYDMDNKGAGIRISSYYWLIAEDPKLGIGASRNLKP